MTFPDSQLIGVYTIDVSIIEINSDMLLPMYILKRY